MSDYYSANLSLTAGTALKAVDSSTKDRVVYVEANVGNLVGFSSSTCFVTVITQTGPIPLPAGEELWIKNASTVSSPILVTKSPASFSLCG